MQRFTVFALASALSVGAPLMPLAAAADEAETMPVAAGDATGQITGGGRSTLFISGRLEAEDGTLVATSNGVFRRVPTDRLNSGSAAKD